MLQCSGQSYGSSVSQTIASEAAIEYEDMNTLQLDSHFHIKQSPCFCCYGNDNSSPPEETMIHGMAFIGNDTFHSTIMWQSQVEIEHYSVAYFDSVTVFTAL